MTLQLSEELKEHLWLILLENKNFGVKILKLTVQHLFQDLKANY